MAEPYYLQVCCRVRSRTVRLHHLESEADLNRPPDLDFTKFQPRYDEDCSADERTGVFTHPEINAFRIANAGCATFWIEFNYGKFIFPRLRNESVDILDDSILDLARKSFGSDFVQACHWG